MKELFRGARQLFKQTSWMNPQHKNDTSSLKLNRADRRFIGSILAILLVLRVAMIFLMPITDPTEARYAEIARKMVETNDWITPQYDYGVPFWGKPPLHTWVSAAGMKIFGVNHFGAPHPHLCLQPRPSGSSVSLGA